MTQGTARQRMHVQCLFVDVEKSDTIQRHKCGETSQIINRNTKLVHMQPKSESFSINDRIINDLKFSAQCDHWGTGAAAQQLQFRYGAQSFATILANEYSTI